MNDQSQTRERDFTYRNLSVIMRQKKRSWEIRILRTFGAKNFTEHGFLTKHANNPCNRIQKYSAEDIFRKDNIQISLRQICFSHII